MLDSKGKYWFLYVAWVGIMITPPLAYAVGPEDAEEWANKTPISISINLPADNTYLPINHTQLLQATASDTDCYRVGTTWYDYSDDVTSGDSPSDYHIFWTASAGFFWDSCGTGAEYLAPDYYSSANNDVRDVTITATTDDDNLYGYNDSSQQKSITLKVWQVTVTVSQTGTKSTNNDATSLPVVYGGTTHGWIIPGTPAGATGYHGNTEIKGTIPDGPGVTTGYTWKSYVKGVYQYKQNGTWNVVEYDELFVPDNPTGYYDVDSKHAGTDVREIFMQDAPGWSGAGASNDIGISIGVTDITHTKDFKSGVWYGGIRISNQPIWYTDFVLDVVNAHWHVVSHTP